MPITSTRNNFARRIVVPLLATAGVASLALSGLAASTVALAAEQPTTALAAPPEGVDTPYNPEDQGGVTPDRPDVRLAGFNTSPDQLTRVPWVLTPGVTLAPSVSSSLSLFDVYGLSSEAYQVTRSVTWIISEGHTAPNGYNPTYFGEAGLTELSRVTFNTVEARTVGDDLDALRTISTAPAFVIPEVTESSSWTVQALCSTSISFPATGEVVSDALLNSEASLCYQDSGFLFVPTDVTPPVVVPPVVVTPPTEVPPVVTPPAVIEPPTVTPEPATPAPVRNAPERVETGYDDASSPSYGVEKYSAGLNYEPATVEVSAGIGSNSEGAPVQQMPSPLIFLGAALVAFMMLGIYGASRKQETKA